VINIITRNASDTRGPLADVSDGDFRRTAQLRYGTAVGQDGFLRLYAQGFEQGDSRPYSPNITDSDAWRGAQGGFRFDDRLAGGAFTAQGDIYRNVIDDQQGSLWGDDLQLRYAKPTGEQSSIEALVYYSRDERTAPQLFEKRDSLDLQLQDNIQADARNAVVWGGEVRVWRETYESQDILAFQKPTTDIVLASLFAQDEFAISPDLKLTAGLKLEESSYSGFEWLPNARLAWRYDRDGLGGGLARGAHPGPDRTRARGSGRARAVAELRVRDPDRLRDGLARPADDPGVGLHFGLLQSL
jgi:iron complex outermembrane receptor protein